MLRIYLTLISFLLWSNICIADLARQIARYDTVGTFKDIFIEGDYAYIANTFDGVAVFDISNPANPILKDSLDNCPAGFQVYGIEKQGNYCFVAIRYMYGAENPDLIDGIFSVIDVSDVENIFEAASTTYDDKLSDISIDGNYAYVASQFGGLNVFDISNPLIPTWRANYSTGDYETQGIHKVGDFAYIANYDHGLSIVNVSDLDAMTEARIDFADSTQELWDVYCEGDYVYGSVMRMGTYTIGGADDSRGMVVYDVTDRTAPIILSQLYFKDYGVCSDNIGGDDPPLKIFKKDNLVFLANGTQNSKGLIVVIDVINPTIPVFLTSFQSDGQENIEALAILGNILVTGDGTGVGTSDFIVFRIGSIIRNATLKNSEIR